MLKYFRPGKTYLESNKVLIIALNQSFSTVCSGTMSLHRWIVTAFIMSLHRLLLLSYAVHREHASSSDVWPFDCTVSVARLVDSLKSDERNRIHSWCSNTCFLLRWWSKLLVLPPAAKTVARQTLQYIVFWSASDFLKPKNFQTADTAPLLGTSSSGASLVSLSSFSISIFCSLIHRSDEASPTC